MPFGSLSSIAFRSFLSTSLLSESDDDEDSLFGASIFFAFVSNFLIFLSRLLSELFNDVVSLSAKAFFSVTAFFEDVGVVVFRAAVNFFFELDESDELLLLLVLLSSSEESALLSSLESSSF